MYKHSADRFVFQILAWMSTQDVRARLQANLDTKNPIGAPRHMREIVHLCLEESLSSLSSDLVFGPALLALAHARLAPVGFQSIEDSVAGAIAVEGVLEPGHALYYLVEEKSEDSPSFALPHPTPPSSVRQG